MLGYGQYKPTQLHNKLPSLHCSIMHTCVWNSKAIHSSPPRHTKQQYPVAISAHTHIALSQNITTANTYTILRFIHTSQDSLKFQLPLSISGNSGISKMITDEGS